MEFSPKNILFSSLGKIPVGDLLKSYLSFFMYHHTQNSDATWTEEREQRKISMRTSLCLSYTVNLIVCSDISCFLAHVSNNATRVAFYLLHSNSTRFYPTLNRAARKHTCVILPIWYRIFFQHKILDWNWIFLFTQYFFPYCMWRFY